MSERVWVVLDKRSTHGDGWVEMPLLGTVARTRTEAVRQYDEGHAWEWTKSEGGYAADHKNGWCRVVTATLTPKAKSKRSYQR